MSIEKSREHPVEFLKALSQTGLEDVHVVNRRTAREVLTEERERLLAEIKRGEAQSVRELARHLDRNVSIVSRDLDVLFEADIIDFEQDGRAKKPVLAHDTVLVKPIVFNGEVKTHAK